MTELIGESAPASTREQAANVQLVMETMRLWPGTAEAATLTLALGRFRPGSSRPAGREDPGFAIRTLGGLFNTSEHELLHLETHPRYKLLLEHFGVGSTGHHVLEEEVTSLFTEVADSAVNKSDPAWRQRVLQRYIRYDVLGGLSLPRASSIRYPYENALRLLRAAGPLALLATYRLGLTAPLLGGVKPPGSAVAPGDSHDSPLQAGQPDPETSWSRQERGAGLLGQAGEVTEAGSACPPASSAALSPPRFGDELSPEEETQPQDGPAPRSPVSEQEAVDTSGLPLPRFGDEELLATPGPGIGR